MDKTTTLEAQAQAEPVTPLPGPIDWTKPVRRKGDRAPLKVLAIEYGLHQPVVCMVTPIGGRSEVWGYHMNGGFFQDGRPCCNDAENVPAPAQPDPLPVLLDAIKAIIATCEGYPQPSHNSRWNDLDWAKHEVASEILEIARAAQGKAVS